MNLLSIIFILIILYLLYDNREFFSNCTIGRLLNSNESYIDDSKITFMSKGDLQSFFTSDPDGYFRSFNSVNLHAFGHTTVDDLVKTSVSVADDFSDTEKITIIKACRDVDRYLLSFKKIQDFPSQKVAEIPWVFAKTKGSVYEKGYPHTRLNIIFLSDRVIQLKSLPQILIHEKVHIFSRLYPNDMRRWIHNNGYIAYRKLEDYPLARKNPDLDGVVYLDKNNKETLAVYPNSQPASMEEAIYKGGDYKSEHPNEALAYEIDHHYKDDN
jgi:hypothetical protein